MAGGNRAVRVAELVRAEFCSLLAKGLKDPRIGFVSVMEVKMSPDLHVANVYVSVYGSDREKKSSLIGLQQASGWIRKELGKRLQLRVTPEIRIFKDDSLDKVYALEDKFRVIHEEEDRQIQNGEA